MRRMRVELRLSDALPLRCAKTSRMDDRPICRVVKPGHDYCIYPDAEYKDGGTPRASHRELRRPVPEPGGVNGSPSLTDPSLARQLTRSEPNTALRATDRQN